MTKRTAAKNIRKVMIAATDEERKSGGLWYQETNYLCGLLAKEYGIPKKAVIFALAAMSPGQRWDTNVKSIRRLLKADSDGTVFDLVLPGYKKNVQKAKDIIYYARRGKLVTYWERFLRGQKVRAFAHNILLGSGGTVTVDVHAYSVAAGKRYTLATVPVITPKVYKLIESAYTQVAEEYDISPSACQAITWLAWRRLIKEGRQ